MQKLLLFPLKNEIKAFINTLQKKNYKVDILQIEQRECFKVEKLHWILSTAGHGKTQFAISTQYFLSFFKDVGEVFCLGTAGSLSEVLHVGEIVVAEKIIEHDFNLKFIKRDKPTFETNANILARFKKHVQQAQGVHFGTIASGDEDIVEIKRKRELQNQTQALATAWEGAGGARACAFNKKPYMEVRAISDLAEGASIEDFYAHLDVAMKNLCEVMIQANPVI